MAGGVVILKSKLAAEPNLWRRLPFHVAELLVFCSIHVLELHDTYFLFSTSEFDLKGKAQ
jgi:hypothetical protein